MSRIFTTLTHAQFYRALLLAQQHRHGWAQELNRCGIRAHPDPQIGIRSDSSSGELAAVAAKLEGASEERWNTWDLIRRAIQERGEVADQDLETFSLAGSEAWPKEMRAGIWSPGVSDTGKTYHTTARGRLSWAIDREGRVELEVCRPGGPLFSVQSWFGCSPQNGGKVQAALDAVSPPAERAGSRTSSEANILRDRIAGAITAQGFAIVYGEDVDELESGGPDVVLSIEPAGNESIVVLQASVDQDGMTVTQQLRAGALLYYRHVETLAKALWALGVQWDPQVDLP